MGKPKLDQFYTQPDIAMECLIHLSYHYEIRNKSWLEPSAGTGVFIEAIKKFQPTSITAYDLEPKAPDIEKADFLTALPPKCDFCIGNPPFGYQGNLALKFFIRATRKCKVIAFILPKTFRKASVVDQIPRGYFPVANLDLTSQKYVVNNGLVKVPTCFQIWEHRFAIRPLATRTTSPYLQKVSKRTALNLYRKGSPVFAVVHKGERMGQIANGVDWPESLFSWYVELVPGVKDFIANYDFTDIVEDGFIGSLAPSELYWILEQEFLKDL